MISRFSQMTLMNFKQPENSRNLFSKILHNLIELFYWSCRKFSERIHFNNFLKFGTIAGWPNIEFTENWFFFFFLLLFVFRNDLLKCGEIHFQTYLFVCMCVCLCLPATCLVSTFLSWRLFQINLLLNNSRIWTLISVLYQLS